MWCYLVPVLAIIINVLKTFPPTYLPYLPTNLATLRTYLPYVPMGEAKSQVLKCARKKNLRTENFD